MVLLAVECPSIPLELDDTAEAHHEDAALAILAAFLEAERKAMIEMYRKNARGASAEKGALLHCDNFA
jgi:hypothetical protein